MSIKNMLVDKTLNTVREKVINPKIADIAKVRSMEFKDGRLALRLTLNGLDDTEIEVVCNKVSISPDGETITVSDFSSNMPFAENALNSFAAGEYKIDAGPVARVGMLAARKMLGLS